MYDQMENFSWKCYCCRSVNVTSFVINAYNLSVSNSFAPLATIPGDDSVYLPDTPPTAEQFVPCSHSSPVRESQINGVQSDQDSMSTSHSSLLSSKGNNIRFVVLNANGLGGKRAELAELCDST